MQPEQQHEEDSDPEDDPDYVPPAEGTNDSDEEPETKRAKTTATMPTEEEELEKKKARDVLWASFEASLPPSKPSATSRTTERKMVKIEKRYRFAGEEVVEATEVPEDSDDARKWPLWKPPVAYAATNVEQSPAAASTSETQQATTSHVSEPVATSSTLEAAPQKPLKRPGPRKPKTKLAPLPEPAKAKKLTTLDKSAMDWKAHISTTPDSALKDELDANRRGGGYLEKIEFLQRVDERKEQAFDANKSTKRRRT
ncbi:bucentaur or craniofacial development-domain-containing protein [Cytidiella melzeri]|nr:bucentaur or craniofacial development-domain-containing protein [Cytidiella melzeri]